MTIDHIPLVIRQTTSSTKRCHTRLRHSCLTKCNTRVLINDTFGWINVQSVTLKLKSRVTFRLEDVSHIDHFSRLPLLYTITCELIFLHFWLNGSVSNGILEENENINHPLAWEYFEVECKIPNYLDDVDIIKLGAKGSLLFLLLITPKPYTTRQDINYVMSF